MFRARHFADSVARFAFEKVARESLENGTCTESANYVAVEKKCTASPYFCKKRCSRFAFFYDICENIRV